MKFCSLPSEITADEAQLLNKDLSTKKLEDIPIDCRIEVERYICNVLVHKAVRVEIIPALDALLVEIRDSLR